MEQRSCSDSHFIQTIRGGLVIKVQNRPAVGSKTLKDVYENEDSKRLRRPASGLLFDYKQVKRENTCLPVADRTSQDIKLKTDELVLPDDDNVDNCLDDDTTLKQLKHQILTKKRKHSRNEENLKPDNANEKPVEDESDLNETLINWKSKCSKNSKTKRKRMNLSVISSSTIAFATKSEQNLVSEGSLQVGCELAPFIHVKVAVPDAEQLGSQNETFCADDSSTGHNEGLNSGGAAPNEMQEMVLCEYGEPLLCAHEYQNFLTNETSFDDFEDVEPISMLVPWDGMSVKLETPELGCEQFLELPPLAIENGKEIREPHSCRSSHSEDPTSDVSGHSRSSSSLKEKSEQRSSSGIQDPDKANADLNGCMALHQEFNIVLFEGIAEADFPHEQDDSLSGCKKNCDSYPDSIILFNTDENLVSIKDSIVDKEQPLTCSLDAIKKNGLNCGSHIGDEFSQDEDKQTSPSRMLEGESQPSLKNRTCDSADTPSTPEQRQPPERLLSRRKAISPSSQERLRLEMNSVELCNDANQYKYNGKLFKNQTEEKASTVRSEIQHSKITVNHGRPGNFSQRKVTISPGSIKKKSQIAEGNLEGPRFSRTLPTFSTGCTSIHGCSKSAVAFSRLQMHDMESLAVKLMNKLKSMKDIVEQKLLFEAHRSVSLKNDADEVKSAIKNATKVEEMARKLLSTMARDCNRFCKIMKMTPNSAAAKKDTVPRRESKKIMFADEAGGKLCHVKFI